MLASAHVFSREQFVIAESTRLSMNFMIRTFLYSICVILLLSHVATSQDTGLPPVGADAIKNLGNVVSKYDKFTDKSKIELALQVRGSSLDGMFFTAFCVYSGQVVPVNAKAFIGLVVTGDEYRFEQENRIILLVDGERQVYVPQRYASRMSNGKSLELLLIPQEFTSNQMAAFAKAVNVEGRLGGYDEFQFTAAQRATLAEFVDKMRGDSQLLNSVSIRPIELPSNFSYSRELDKEKGMPAYTLMPDSTAMAEDAKDGMVFQALGVMAQPEISKYTLALINAQMEYQLHRDQDKGAVIKIDQEVIRIPQYGLLLKKEIGLLKMETAAVTISKDVFAKLLKADRITIQCGSVIYELDRDNIEALKYLGQQISMESKPKN